MILDREFGHEVIFCLCLWNLGRGPLLCVLNAFGQERPGMRSCLLCTYGIWIGPGDTRRRAGVCKSAMLGEGKAAEGWTES